MSQAEFRRARGGVPVWATNRAETALVNRRKGVILGNTFGVSIQVKLLHVFLITPDF